MIKQQAVERKTKKKLKKSNIGLLLLVVFIFVLILISTVFNDWSQIVENRKEVENLNKYYEELKEEGAALNSEVTKLQDPEYVARYAREKYMFTKDGETILRIIDGKVVTENE